MYDTAHSQLRLRSCLLRCHTNHASGIDTGFRVEGRARPGEAAGNEGGVPL
jgi:hypothetical protein